MHLKELIHICAIVQRCLLHIQNQFLIIKQTYFQIINPVKIQSEKFSDQDHCRNLPLVLVDFMYFSCSHCVQDEQMLHSLQKTIQVECTLSFRDFIRVTIQVEFCKNMEHGISSERPLNTDILFKSNCQALSLVIKGI